MNGMTFRCRELLIGFTLLALLMTPAVCFGAEFQWGNSLTISEPTDGSLFTGGQYVDVQAPVRGDLYCFGQHVAIDAEVQGDVLCFARDLDISGTVRGDVRSGAYSVGIENSVARSVTVAGENVTLSPASRTGGDLVVAAKSVQLMGDVTRDVIGFGETIKIGSTVGKSVWVSAGDLSLGKDGRIEGDLSYWKNEKLTDVDGYVGGVINFYRTGTTASEKTEDSEDEGWFRFRVWSYLYFTVAFLMVGYLLGFFESEYTDEVVRTIIEHPGPSLGWGLVTCFVPPPLMVLLSLLIVGIPLAALSGLAWMLILGLSVIVTAVAAGQFTLRKTVPEYATTLWSVTLGVPLFGLLTSVPWIGWLFVLLGVFVGSGAIFRTLFVTRQSAKLTETQQDR